jgi:hypothetical protein
LNFTGKQITDWLIQRKGFVHSGIVTLDQVEVDFFDMFFDVHPEVLEILWTKIMES